MTLAVLYLATFIVFLAFDFIGLKFILKPIFERYIPSLLLQRPRFGPAIVFYAFYIAGVLWFVSWPAVAADHSLLQVFWPAALLGAMAYGTYEFTNWATLKDWTGHMVITDLVWGTLLTGVSAALGVALLRLAL